MLGKHIVTEIKITKKYLKFEKLVDLRLSVAISLGGGILGGFLFILTMTATTIDRIAPPTATTIKAIAHPGNGATGASVAVTKNEKTCYTLHKKYSSALIFATFAS